MRILNRFWHGWRTKCTAPWEDALFHFMDHLNNPEHVRCFMCKQCNLEEIRNMMIDNMKMSMMPKPMLFDGLEDDHDKRCDCGACCGEHCLDVILGPID